MSNNINTHTKIELPEDLPLIHDRLSNLIGELHQARSVVKLAWEVLSDDHEGQNSSNAGCALGLAFEVLGDVVDGLDTLLLKPKASAAGQEQQS